MINVKDIKEVVSKAAAAHLSNDDMEQLVKQKDNKNIDNYFETKHKEFANRSLITMTKFWNNFFAIYPNIDRSFKSR